MGMANGASWGLGVPISQAIHGNLGLQYQSTAYNVGQLTGTLLSIGAGINTASRVSAQLVLPRASIEVGAVAKNTTQGLGDITIQFGRNTNQIHHVFRHTDALGLERNMVQSTVQEHLKKMASQMVPGRPFNQVIEVGGQRIQYTAFKLKDGTVNIGRIHSAP